MSMRIFLIVSCLPSILLMIYVYKKDRVDKEPIKLLVLLFILGAVSCLPAAIAERIFTNLYVSAFGNNGLHYSLYENFLNVALFEELFKFLMLFLVTHKSKHFNSLFDGIVYAVFVALGFATLENILYVSQYGLGVGLMRAVTAIPGHMFDGVIMGQFYTLWHLSKNISLTEKVYAQHGYIDTIIKPESRYKLYLPLTLIAPILTHGMYDFLASNETTLSFIIFIVFLVGLYIYCFHKIRQVSKKDNAESNLIAEELIRKYPYLPERLQAAAAYNRQMYYNPFTQPAYNPYVQQPMQGYQPYAQQPTQGYQPYAQQPAQGYQPHTQQSTAQNGYQPYPQQSAAPSSRQPYAQPGAAQPGAQQSQQPPTAPQRSFSPQPNGNGEYTNRNR